MEPSLLAAFSAPTAVSVVPICFASSAVTAASADPATVTPSARASILRIMVFSSGCCLERGLEGEREPATVLERGIRPVRDRHGAGRIGGVVAVVAVVAEVHAIALQDVRAEARAVVAVALVAAERDG